MTSRFDEYARRKTRIAASTQLPGFETRRAPRYTPPGMIAVGNDWSCALFDGWFYRSEPRPQALLPALSLVFVESSEGNTVADDPEALGGGATDKHLVYEGLSRIDADGVLAGATTAVGDETVFSVWHPELVRLRAERGHARHPAQIIVTGSGNLPIETALLYDEPELRTLVVTSSRGAAVAARKLAERRWVEVVDCGDPIDLRRAMRELYARGLRVISVVGGRRTAQALLRLDVVAELYLTTSPRSGGQPNTPLVEGELPLNEVVVAKAGRGAERGVQFQHFRFENCQG